MSVYWIIFTTTVKEYFVYRLNFLLWRFRNIVTLFVKYSIWAAAFAAGGKLFGYSQSQLLTYILMSHVISSFVLASRTSDIAGEIVQGKIIDYILKPMDFFTYHMARDGADKFLNITMQTGEILIFAVLVQPPFFVQTDPLALTMALLSLITGTIIAFFVNMAVSFVGFWSPEVWAPRFIFSILSLVATGGYFPLDILPRWAYVTLFLTPFPYMYYVPTRAYLGLPNREAVFILIGSLGWCFLSFSLTRTLWRRGLKSFGFFGR